MVYDPEKTERLIQQRGNVIHYFTIIEGYINDIIDLKYIGLQGRLDFIVEVLCDEYFSFGLKINILEKIIPQNDANKKLPQDLRTFSNIRNKFAHCGTHVPCPNVDGLKGKDYYIPNPKKPYEELDFDSLYEESQKLFGKIIETLLGIWYDFQKKAEDQKVPLNLK